MAKRIGFAFLLVEVVLADLNFLAIGDWGKVNDAFKSVTAGMEKVAKENDAAFVVLLGDNFYTYGIHGDDHSRQFKTVFEDMYHGEKLQKIPFYAIAGNHDHYGNVSAQIAYTGDSERWVFPEYYYNKVFKIPGTNGKTLELILIDTVIGVGNTDHNKRRFLQPPGPAHVPTAEAQWNWLTKTLAASTADYIWVGGHYPVYSACRHGPTYQLISRLKPKLEQYGAHYMAGHDHCQGHIDEGRGVQYVVAGAGQECCYADTNKDHVPKNSIKFWMSGHHGSSYQSMPHGLKPKSGFASFKVSAHQMTVSYHSHGGEVLFTTPPIRPRGEVTRPPPPVPTPAPSGQWACHAHSTTNIEGLYDHDGMTPVTVGQCKETCLATPDCRVVVYHATSGHCHTLSGKQVTRAKYEASIRSESTHQTCMYIPHKTNSNSCARDNDCPHLQFCSSKHECVSLSHTYCDNRICGLGDGDCDYDWQCSGDLVCGNNNCAQFHPHIGSRHQDDGNVPDCCEEGNDVVVVHGRNLRHETEK